MKSTYIVTVYDAGDDIMYCWQEVSSKSLKEVTFAAEKEMKTFTNYSKGWRLTVKKK